MLKKIIIDAIVNTNPNKRYFASFEGFDKFRSNRMFNRLNEKYDSLSDAFFINHVYPKSVEDELLRMIDSDQEVRNGNDKEQMAFIDSLNINRLIEITSEYGWIDRGWLLLWHQRGNYNSKNNIWNHFRPLIDKEIQGGKQRKSFWAMFEDERSIYKSGNQIYGMYGNQFDVQDVQKC